MALVTTSFLKLLEIGCDVSSGDGSSGRLEVQVLEPGSRGYRRGSNSLRLGRNGSRLDLYVFSEFLFEAQDNDLTIGASNSWRGIHSYRILLIWFASQIANQFGPACQWQ